MKWILVLSSILLGCSGGSADVSDATADATDDTTTSDATMESSDMDTGMDAADDVALDAGTCADAGGRIACERCCAQAYPQGFDVFATAALKCACVPSLCGETDAGNDGGTFGTGACAATCMNPMKNPPDNKCLVCLRDSEGKPMDAGPCEQAVQNACSKSAACKTYEACTKACQ